MGQALPGEVWAAALVFCRLAATLMVVPGFGEQAIPMRIRLSFALLVALCVTPVVRHTLPALPVLLSAQAGLVIREVVSGLMLGAVIRLMLSALNVAGEVMSIASGISFAQTANPMQAQTSTSISSFLMMLGITLVFATNLHHLFLGAMVDSYQLFPPLKGLPLRDGGEAFIKTLSLAFSTGIQLSAPVLVFGMIFNVAAGLVARIMPQFQVYFAVAPLSILSALAMMALGIGVFGFVFLDRYREVVDLFMVR